MWIVQDWSGGDAKRFGPRTRGRRLEVVNASKPDSGIVSVMNVLSLFEARAAAAQ